MGANRSPVELPRTHKGGPVGGHSLPPDRSSTAWRCSSKSLQDQPERVARAYSGGSSRRGRRRGRGGGHACSPGSDGYRLQRRAVTRCYSPCRRTVLGRARYVGFVGGPTGTPPWPRSGRGGNWTVHASLPQLGLRCGRVRRVLPNLRCHDQAALGPKTISLPPHGRIDGSALRQIADVILGHRRERTMLARRLPRRKHVQRHLRIAAQVGGPVAALTIERPGLSVGPALPGPSHRRGGLVEARRGGSPNQAIAISPKYASRITGLTRISAAVPDSTTWPVCST